MGPNNSMRGKSGMSTVNTEILILSADSEVRSAVESSLSGICQYHFADEVASALDLAARSPVGVLVLDVDSAGNDIGSLVASLQALAPGIVTILVGEHDDLAALTHLNIDGTIYRFVMKPVSGGQLRMAVEAAAGKFNDEQMGGSAQPDPAKRTASGPLIYAGLAALALAAGSLAWILTSPSQQDVPVVSATLAPPESIVAEEPLPAAGQQIKPGVHSNRFGLILARAEQAMQQGYYLVGDDGTGDDAVTLYGRVLADDPDNPAALKGLEKIMRVFVGEATTALSDGDLDTAERAFDRASRVLPNDPRLSALESQLIESRVSELVAEANSDAEAGDLQEAKQTLSQAEALGAVSVESLEATRAAIEQRYRAEQASRFLSLGYKRVADGRLVEPADDSALTYLRAARNNGSDNEVLAPLAKEIAGAMLARSQAMLEDGSLLLAQEWLDRAVDLDADISGVDAVRATIARRLAEDAEKDRLLALAAERLAEQQLIEPQGDSARDYLLAVQAISPEDPVAEQGLDRVVTGLLEQSAAALEAGELSRAEFLLAEARTTGARGDGPDGLQQRIQLAMAPVPEPVVEEVVDPIPVRRKYVPPKYPRDALLRGLEGTVAVSFTVAPDGGPENIAVVSATPRNTFDRAAMAAVRQWQFDPAIVDGQAVSHPMEVEIEFVLDE